MDAESNTGIKMEKVFPVAVIGGGSAGVMATQRAVLNNDEVLFFPGSPKQRKKSRAFWVAKVENMPAHFQFKKGIEEPNKEVLNFLEESAFQEKFHWMKNRGIEKLDKREDGIFELTDNKDETYLAEHVILCTGVMDIQPEIDGDIAPVLPFANVQVIDYCIRCDGHHILGKKTSVIGHGIGAAWVAIILHERYNPPSMTILTHGKKPEFDDEVKKILKAYSIGIETSEILGVKGNAKEHLLEGFELKDKFFPTEFSFVSLGMLVYNELATALGAEVDERGFVITDQQGKSSVEGLYIAGDLRANLKKQIYTAWDSAVDATDAINSLLRRRKREQTL